MVGSTNMDRLCSLRRRYSFLTSYLPETALAKCAAAILTLNIVSHMQHNCRACRCFMFELLLITRQIAFGSGNRHLTAQPDRITPENLSGRTEELHCNLPAPLWLSRDAASAKML